MGACSISHLQLAANSGSPWLSKVVPSCQTNTGLLLLWKMGFSSSWWGVRATNFFKNWRIFQGFEDFARLSQNLRTFNSLFKTARTLWDNFVHYVLILKSKTKTYQPLSLTVKGITIFITYKKGTFVKHLATGMNATTVTRLHWAAALGIQ